MPFLKIDIDKKIEQMRNADPEFREAWDNSRMEFELIGQLIKLRKEKGLTLEELAEKSGEKKQVISEIIEERGERLNLTTLYRLASALDVDLDIRLIPR